MQFEHFIKQFTEHPFHDVKKVGRAYYLVDDSLWGIKEGITRDMFSAGLFLGEERGHFIPTPVLMELIAKMPDSADKKIFVNKKAEWLFLCRRNILESSITKNPGHLTEGLVLVQNERDENLGYGIFKQEGKDLIIRNLLDRGHYLRVNEKGRK